MTAPVLQFKRGNAGVAGTVPALRPGEPAISLNNFDFFIGIDTSVANNKFFGSHRYWGREDGTNSLKLKLVDKNGTNYVAIKAPDTISGITTYTFPETPVDGYFLKTNSTGTLSWDQVVSNINIAADSGTPDLVGTGSTITFSGGSNVNTAVTDNTITINLDDNVSLSGILTVGTGIGITQFSSSVSTGTSTSSVPTSSAVINYVGSLIGNVDLTLGINADTGGPSTVSTSQTLTVGGTANEIRTSVSGQTITVGLTTNVTVSNDLTVQGNLYVNGSTTQVNTAALTVEDRTIDLGIVNGAAPTSATTWDLGVLFNYFDTAAKKSGVIWEHSATRFQFASTLTSESGSTDANNPQIVTATFAPIEIGALWVTDCAGTSQVISCTGTERFLENITVDAGQF